MQFLKDFINAASNPPVMLTLFILLFFFVFPPTNWFMQWNKRLGIRAIWTNKGGIIMVSIIIAFYFNSGFFTFIILFCFGKIFRQKSFYRSK